MPNPATRQATPPRVPADLAHVVSAWAALPEPIRVAIRAIIEASKPARMAQDKPES